MQIKKKISKFLVGEESKIPKKALVGMGVALATIGIAAVAQTHSSTTSLNYNKPQMTGMHSSHTASGPSTTTTHTSTSPTTTSVPGSGDCQCSGDCTCSGC